jgi:PAS domain S-box-containing protein
MGELEIDNTGLEISNMKSGEQKRGGSERPPERAGFQLLSENVPFGLVMIGQDGTFEYVNPKFKELFGYDLADVPSGRAWFRKAYPDPDYRHHVISIWMDDLKHFNPGEQKPRAFNATCKDGTTKIINFITVQLENGQILIACEDITERRRTEEALRYRIEFEKLIMTLSTHFINLASNEVDGAIYQALQTIGEFAGVGRSYVFLFSEGGKKMDNTHEWCAPGIEPQIQRLKEIRVDEELPYFGKIIRSHQVFYVPRVADLPDEARAEKEDFRFQGIQSLICVPMIYGSSLIGFLGFDSVRTEKAWSEDMIALLKIVGEVFVSALERQRVEQALRKNEERFRELYDNAPLGYHEYDTEGRITNVNRTDLEMLGYTAEEMIGQPMWKFNVEEEDAREQILRKLAGTLPPGRSLERAYRRKNGSTFPVLIEDRLILDEKGRISGIRCTIQDIAERKRAEREMFALQDQLRQAMKMEAIGQLAGGIAHDFNNLLTIISGYSQLSLNQLRKGEPLRENIEEIQKATERAAALTRQLLAFSRRQIMEIRVLDLNTVLRDLEKLLRRIIGEDIKLITVLSEDLGRMKADPGQIEQVILNLAVNARDAMPAGGKFILETSNVELDEAYARSHISVKPGSYIKICVSDTGAGMSTEVRERIFEPFFTTKETGKGTGLGLSTVYGIVNQSGGNIWAYSEVGRGTTFKIYFPRVEEARDAPKQTAAPVEILHGSETILLVEDEEAVRTLARKTLESCGYRILEASNGLEALRVAEGHSEPALHLLLTDVVMPGMGGRDLADQLIRLRPEMKVLYMSGYTDNAIVHHGILNPGIQFLQKPFSPQFLVQKVQETLKSRSEGIQSPE